MTGAIAIAAMAAMRAGAGLVTAAVPDLCLELVASFHPCMMTLPLPCDGKGRFTSRASSVLQDWNRKPDILAIGPGLGSYDAATEWVIELYLESKRPMVLDADALNALAGYSKWPINGPAPRILTPHPKEFERLSGISLGDREKQIEAAKKMAHQTRSVVILKGHATFVTDGEQEYVNTTGNPGMATGGSGDCLTGFIAALLCQGLNPWEASTLGVYLHGKAGDLALHHKGGPSVLATDLIDHFSEAFSSLDVK